MVCTAALHFAAAAVFGPPPEVAAADDQPHLNSHVQTLLDDIAHLTDDLKIKAGMFVSRKSLTADFQQDTMIYRFFHNVLLWHIISAFILPYFQSFGKGVSEDFHRKIPESFFVGIPFFFLAATDS